MVPDIQLTSEKRVPLARETFRCKRSVVCAQVSAMAHGVHKWHALRSHVEVR